MTDAKILEVLDIYNTALTCPNYDDNAQIQWCLGMIPQMVQFLKEGRREKTFRWLGFIQGVLYANGVFTVPEMADHNRPHQETV